MEFPNEKLKVLILKEEDERENLFADPDRNILVDYCTSETALDKKISAENYDIFLLDISAGNKMNSKSMTKIIRSRKEYKNTPIVCISSNEDKKLAFDTGADEFLTRPIENEKLVDSLIKIYKRKSGQILE